LQGHSCQWVGTIYATTFNIAGCTIEGNNTFVYHGTAATTIYSTPKAVVIAGVVFDSAIGYLDGCSSNHAYAAATATGFGIPGTSGCTMFNQAVND
jgi:hypothetical protein